MRWTNKQRYADLRKCIRGLLVYMCVLHFRRITKYEPVVSFYRCLYLPKGKRFFWCLINGPMLLVVRKINPIQACYLQSGTIMGPRQLYYRNHTQLSSTNIHKVLEDIWYMLSFFLKTIPLSQFIFKWGCGMIHIFSWLKSGERKPLRHSTFRKFIHI